MSEAGSKDSSASLFTGSIWDLRCTLNKRFLTIIIETACQEAVGKGGAIFGVWGCIGWVGEEGDGGIC